MKKNIIAIDSAPQAIGPYSQGIEVSGAERLYYFSGQIAIDPATSKLVDGDEKAQMQQILKNIGNLLLSQDMTHANVVKTTVFLTDISKFAEINLLYGAFFESKPARSCVEVTRLPLGAKVEVEIIAAK